MDLTTPANPNNHTPVACKQHGCSFNNMKRIILSALVAILSAGCVTTPKIDWLAQSRN
jgi:hypothetical protein